MAGCIHGRLASEGDGDTSGMIHDEYRKQTSKQTVFGSSIVFDRRYGLTCSLDLTFLLMEIDEFKFVKT